MAVHFTKHARQKFQVLPNHKFTERQIIEAVEKPDLIEYSRLPLLIAQKKLNRNYVLRVVYRLEREIKIIITFYPGRTKQYEKS